MLKKVIESGKSDVFTKYAGNYIYKKEGASADNLEFFSQPEGYVKPKEEEDISQEFDYVYQYKDHLGNVRLSYTENNGSLEIVEENNYYPFGLKHKGYNFNVSSTNLAQNYKFGGKEYNDELGLGWYDVSARNYDPALGRWMNLDPLAEKMRRHSPYNYAFDNPVYFIDPDGMMPIGNPIKKIINRAANRIADKIINKVIEITSAAIYTVSKNAKNALGKIASKTKVELKAETKFDKRLGVKFEEKGLFAMELGNVISSESASLSLSMDFTGKTKLESKSEKKRIKQLKQHFNNKEQVGQWKLQLKKTGAQNQKLQ